jgi:transcriptional regulator with XRE-family HTH domain
MATEPLGTRIAKRRHQLRLSQEELAERLGVNRTSVANWEAGKHYPQRHIGALEQVLGIRLDGATEDEYSDPDEARIWGWTEYAPHERRAMISALREARAGRAG